MINRVFDDLTVIEKTSDRAKDGSIIWKCKCSCNKICFVSTTYLNRGRVTSCGCKNKPKREISKLYKVWSTMKDRCNNPNNKGYSNYGGRNVKVCDEWNDYDNFYAWSIENGYDESLSLDRINNDGNYEPSNCRWSTRREQNENKRNNHLETINGLTFTLSQWARKYNLNYKTIYTRYKRGKRNEELIAPLRHSR